MPKGRCHEIISLPDGYYRLEALRAKTPSSSEVRVFNLDTAKLVAVMTAGGRGRAIETDFELAAPAVVRLSHHHREESAELVQGALTRVIGGPSGTLLFCCESTPDDDYDDLRVLLTRYNGPDHTDRIPVFFGEPADLESRIADLEARLLGLKVKLGA